MKTIYWIDDNFKVMSIIVRGAFPLIWENKEGIANKIIVFGNAYQVGEQEVLLCQEDENEYRRRVHDIFVRYCENLEGINPEKSLYSEKKFLIEESVMVLFKRESGEELKLYNEIKKMWQEQTVSSCSMKDDVLLNKAKPLVSELLDKMKIGEDAVIGIDLEILRGDHEKILNSNRTISMEIYNQLTQKNRKCFLYSSDAMRDCEVIGWREGYKKYYSGTEEQINVYKRMNLSEKRTGTVVEDIIEMFDK